MSNKTALRITLTCFALIGTSAAQTGERAMELAAIQTETGRGNASPRPNAAGPSPAVINEVMRWVSDSLDLPATTEHPRIELVPPRRLATMRYKNLLGAAPQAPNAEAAASQGPYQREVVALYEDATRTIYLPEGWTGKTPAEISILVHEMVHHLQNLAGIKYECPAAREKPAYRAQDRWLGKHGLDIEQEFELDRFTIFVGSTCLG